MLILVEGIDKSGKTTFIQKLSSKTGIPSYRKSYPKELREENFHNYFKGIGYSVFELSNVLDFNLIIDRSFISDWVYSNRSENNYSFKVWREWESLVESNNVLIIYLTIPFNIFKKRISESPDYFMDVSEYQRYVNLYDFYFSKTSFPFIKIRGDIDFKKQYETIKSKLNG